MMIAVPNYISPEDYLDIERDSPIRHEYRCGLVYAMAGGTDNHDRIAYNCLKLIDNHLGSSTDCRFYGSNVKVNYRGNYYYYPDAFVTCDPRDRRDRYIKRYPKLIVEILSAGTEEFDAGDKFKDYQLLESLQEYGLVSQDSQRVEVWRRTAESWQSIVYEAGDRVSFTSLGLEFAIDELYRGLD